MSSSSPLESLPTELLSKILLACLNAHLPLASRILHAKLSSPHLIRQFRILSKKSEYIVTPTDGCDKAACARVEQELRRVTCAGK
ncbi:MAG: hypothetical protein Q9207_004933, partial [Kuettlingeria erythrocarpa]